LCCFTRLIEQATWPVADAICKQAFNTNQRNIYRIWHTRTIGTIGVGIYLQNDRIVPAGENHQHSCS